MNALKCALAVLGLASIAHAEPPATQPTNDRAPVGERLLMALETTPNDDTALFNAITAAASELPEKSRVRQQLSTMSKDSLDRDAVKQLAQDLAFTPRMEAPTPAGWPTLTPVGEVELKSYPKYRMAYVDRGNTLKGGEFFTLFFHIQRNQIAMTGPVEMEMTDDQRPQMKRMAFLYQNTDIGSLGKDQAVTVVDVEPMEAVSVGVRGNYGGATMKNARTSIDAWLAKHPDYEPASELRVMGYNSPSIPPDQRYAEIQLPVKRR